MSLRLIVAGFWFLSWIFVLVGSWPDFAVSDAVECATFQNSKFGKIRVFGNLNNVQNVVVFISGGGGFNERSLEVASALSAHALLIGMDGNSYRSGIDDSSDACVYLSGELVRLVQSVESALNLPVYIKPYLAGYGEGASLALVAYAGAPSTFRGLLTMHFCPELALTRNVCELESVSLRPNDDANWMMLPARSANDWAWVNVRGEQDSSCVEKPVRNFIRDMGAGYFAELKADNSGYKNASGWMPSIWAKLLHQVSALNREEINKASNDSVDAIVTVIPSSSEKQDLVIFMSGDGGWSPVEVEISKQFADNGYSVVGLNSLEYFWSQRNPEETSEYISSLSMKYLDSLKKTRFVLVGFGLGAEGAVVASSHFDLNVRQKLRAILLMSPARKTLLRAQIGDWIGASSYSDLAGATDGQINILSLIPKVGGVRIVCAYGKESAADSLCSQLSSARYVLRPFPGGKHFLGNYAEVTNELISVLSAR